MESKIQTGYDTICYITYSNIKYITNRINYIALKDFDETNKEHLFVLSLINACHGLLDNKRIIIYKGLFTRYKLAKQNKAFPKIERGTGKEAIQVDVPKLLEDMRGYACELCGVDFKFGDIYDAYYSGKENI